MKEKINLRLISNIVIVYMLCAFTWWSALLYKKNLENFELNVKLGQLEMIQGGFISSLEQYKDLAPYLAQKQKYEKQKRMIFGEAIIFISSLIFGIWLINRGHKIQVKTEQQTRNFLLSITHELKSPLASIKLVLETLVKRELPKDRRDQLLQNSIKDTDRLTDLVNDLLLASKVEAHYQPHKEKFDLQELMSDIIHDFKDHHQNIQVDFDCPQNSIVMSGDKQGLESVFENLLENARKYSFDEVKINVMLAQKDGKALLSFADQGIGIADVEKKNIFEKFYRVGNENTRKAKGTGLGLYIVNEVIKHHQGKIVVSDNTPKGTVFKVVLPMV
jgi:signal transduction histidine kinase